MRIKKEHTAVFAVFVFAYILRVWFLADGALTFGYDQARDAFVTHEILDGDLKILGPPSSTPGLYHGVLYNYILLPAYFFGANPLNAAYWIALINAGTVFVVFVLTKLISKARAPAFIAAFLFAVSFESSQYAAWLSNPTVAVFFVPFLYLGLWLWTENRKKLAPVIVGVGLGFAVQAEIFLLYHAVPALAWLWLRRKGVVRGQFILFTAAFFATISTILVSEIKFGFRGVEGLLSLASSQQGASPAGFGDVILLFLNQLGRVFSFNSYPGNVGYGAALILGLIFFGLWKAKGKVDWSSFLALWLFSHATVVSVGGTSTPFLLVGIGPAVSIILGIYLGKWWQSGYKLGTVLVLVTLVYSNLTFIFGENPKGQTIFAIQKDMLLSKETAALDYIYESAQEESFSVNTVTSPLWVNTTWSYLFNNYAEPKYGYLPFWHGRGQEGRHGNNLVAADGDMRLRYLILEPPAGIPMTEYMATIDREDALGALAQEKRFGELVVQKRILYE